MLWGALLTRKGPLVDAVKWRANRLSLTGAGRKRPSLALFSVVLGIFLLVIGIFSHVAEARRAKDPSELLSLNFQNAQLSKVIETLVFQRRVNIVYPPDLNMPVTARLEKVHWKDALDAILKNHGYGFVEVGNIIRIDKVEKLEKEQITKEYPLNRVSAETIDPVLKGIIGGDGRFQYIPKAPTLEGDERGTLMVSASVENHDLVERALANLAVPTGSTKPYVEGPEGGDRMSMRFVRTPVDQAMRMLCRRVGLNVVWESKPKGFVTLDVVHVKFVQALDAILIPLEYRHIQEDNSIRVVSKEAFKEAQYSRVFEMKYGLASVVQPVITEAIGDAGTVKLIGEEGTSKKLLVKAPEEELRDTERLIASLDKPVQQILINLLIVEVTLGDNLTLGIDWSTSLSMQGGSRPTRFPFGGSDQAPQPGEISFGLINASGLGGAFEALRLKSNVKVLSEPSVTTQDNQESRILVGQSYPIAVETLDRQTLQRTVTLDRYQDIGIELKVLPSVCEDGLIDMRLDPKVSEVGQLVEDRFPVINTREASTRVRVRHGQAAVIGGLIRTRKEKSRRAIPVLSKLPAIGKLFRSKRNDETRSELLIFVIPKIIGYEKPFELGEAKAHPAPVRVLERSVKATEEQIEKAAVAPAKSTVAEEAVEEATARVAEKNPLPAQKAEVDKPEKRKLLVKESAAVEVAQVTEKPATPNVEKSPPINIRKSSPVKNLTSEFALTQAALQKALQTAKKDRPMVKKDKPEKVKVPLKVRAQKLFASTKKAPTLDRKVAKAMVEDTPNPQEAVGPEELYKTIVGQNPELKTIKTKAAVKKPVIKLVKAPARKAVKKLFKKVPMEECFPEPAALPGAQKHVVAKGETLWAIARRYNTKVHKLQELNPELANIDSLAIGDTLIVPELVEKTHTLAAATMTPSE